MTRRRRHFLHFAVPGAAELVAVAFHWVELDLALERAQGCTASRANM